MRQDLWPEGTTSGAGLRVLMITSEWPIADGRARTTHFIKRQADFLRAAGVEVDVLHFNAAKNPWNYFRGWVRARRRLAQTPYDLVHAQFGQSGLLALPKRVPLVVTLRGDDIGGIVGPRLRVTAVGHVLRQVTRAVARVADAVIVVSEHMNASLHSSARAHVIPSGLDLRLFRPMPRDAARRRLGLPLDQRVVLFVGSPATPRKRYPLAQRAVEILNRSLPAELVVAWGIQHAEIPLYLNAADVLLFTSMQEGSPNAVKEALACDLPVVSVPVGDVAQRLRDVAGCELCVDERPEAIAGALERVLRRGERINGRAAVRELDEERTTQRVIAVYRSVLSRGAARRRRVDQAPAAAGTCPRPGVHPTGTGTTMTVPRMPRPAGAFPRPPVAETLTGPADTGRPDVDPAPVLGDSRELRAALDLARRAAATDASVAARPTKPTESPDDA